MNTSMAAEEAEKRKNEALLSSINPILDNIIDQLSEVDFTELADLRGKNMQIPNKVYVVGTVEELLKQLSLFGSNICYKNNTVFLYNGQFWDGIEQAEFKRFLSQSARKLGVEFYTSKHYEFADKLERQFQLSASLPTPPQTKNKTLVNLKNGTLEISEKETIIRAFDPKDFLRYQLPFDYDEKEKCVLYDKFLQEVLPDEELRDVVHEFIGYVFLRYMKLEKVLVMDGEGSNGKSTLGDIVSALVGKVNITNFSLEALNKETARFEIVGKLLNFSSENKKGLSSELLKAIASREPIQVKRLYEQPFSTDDLPRLIMNTNGIPLDQGESTYAFIRRFLIIPFDVTIADDKKDIELGNKIISKELGGVFNRVLEGIIRLKRTKGFTKSAIIDSAINEFKKDLDSVQQFIDDEGLKPSTTHKKEVQDVYILYRNYCDDSGKRPLSKPKFLKSIKKQGFEVERGTGNKLVVWGSFS